MKKLHPAIAEHVMEENEKLRRLLEAALFYVPHAGLRADISAALSQQAGPVCRCTMSQRMVGDGCYVCNPEYAADHEAEPAPAQTEQQPVVYAVHGKGLAVDRDCELISPDEAGDYMPGCVTALYAAPIAQTAPQPEHSADIVLNPEEQKVLTDCIGAHAYIVATITNGRPDLALAEASKWVESFREASAALSAQGSSSDE